MKELITKTGVRCFTLAIFLSILFAHIFGFMSLNELLGGLLGFIIGFILGYEPWNKKEVKK